MSEAMTFNQRLQEGDAAQAGPPFANERKNQAPMVELLVLIIDDDRDTALAAAMRLRTAGHQVLVEHDGPSGLARAIERRPDVILLDLHMPTTDGLTTLRWLSEHAATASIPIVAFSADESMRREALISGATRFVGKPYAVQQLTNALSSIAAGAERERRQVRQRDFQIATRQLRQDVARVQMSMSRLNNILKDVDGKSDKGNAQAFANS